MYQRNYAWTQAQTTQLVRDIWDFKSKEQNYYIGTLIVYPVNESEGRLFETIDGQQRLTTLNILISVLKNEFGIRAGIKYASRLQFASRPLSSKTLTELSRMGAKVNEDELNGIMLQAYLDMNRELDQLSNGDPVKVKEFAKYMFTKVRVVRVPVPKGTDLNHYFEIMNSRGEQLEKHEIVKARFLELLQDQPESSKAFAKIWEACSAMDRYMVTGFSRKLRNGLFLTEEGKWDNIPRNFNDILIAVKKNASEEKTNRKINTTLLSIIDNPKPVLTADIQDNEAVTRFTSVVTFPNFLLHVLRATTGRDIALDDKHLLPIFENEIKVAGNASFARTFAWNLLRIRFMLDKYVIKRELTDRNDGWSLKSPQPYRENNIGHTNTFGTDDTQAQVIMLISMFHVSFPQPTYKHWLTAVLHYLSGKRSGRVNGRDYIAYLETLSDAFYFDRFGKTEMNFYKIVFTNHGKPIQNKVRLSKLNDGTNVQNYIFNRLDYLLWRAAALQKEKNLTIPHIANFEFTFRSSVEHFYPQHPVGDHPVLDPRELNSFGNLCLISRAKNSKLSNYLPSAKADQHRSVTVPESLKQQVMMGMADNWDEVMIRTHGVKMIEILQNGY